MNSEALMTIGLTEPQADAYLALLELGALKPPELAERLGTTRTNAYKLLDKLVELQLANKSEEQRKIVYRVSNPIALSALTSSYRAEAVAREEAARSIMQDLLAQYHSHSDRPDVQVFTGRKEVAKAYRLQLDLREEVFFLHTRSDVIHMGFDTMHEIRMTPAQHGLQRHGILVAPATKDGPVNNEAHARSNLHDLTWAGPDDYAEPVEWSATKSSLLIVRYEGEPHAILIMDALVAGAYLQIWRLLKELLTQRPLHRRLKQSDG